MLVRILIFLPLLIAISCSSPTDSNMEMNALLRKIAIVNTVHDNVYNSQGRVAFYDSIYNNVKDENSKIIAESTLIRALLENGEEDRAIQHCNQLLAKLSNNNRPDLTDKIMRELGIAWLRMAEKTNCINDHNSESCVFPVQGGGLHKNPAPAKKAIEVYESILKKNPDDLSSRWLLNISYMVIGGYPQQVPSEYLIKPYEDTSDVLIKPFTDAAIRTGLDVNNRAGGTIIEDFNNDGNYDVVTSSESLDEPMHYFINNGDGTFSDASEYSGLKLIAGGLNIVQTDYNNDGFKDIFVTRRGWKTKFGIEPKSLLRNNGDNTFTDVTKEAGLLTFYPSQSATWADFNNDGWIDVFVANEAEGLENFFCELFINNKKGGFVEVAGKSNVKTLGFIKGVTSGDYNNDGLVDMFLSGQNGEKILFQNTGNADGIPVFKDVTKISGIENTDGTSTTWFWDYDNDGWLDLLLVSKKFNESPTWYFAMEALGNKLPGKEGKLLLYRNKGDGTFEEISGKVGLDKVAIAMGANFGDIDNDGYLDFYLGTGNLDFSVLVPNKLFRNSEGKKFVDITTAARVGNLQKGHGVSIADLDNDGDQDIYVDLGGAYKGDSYQSALYINPGQNNNRYIKLDLKGTTSNAAAIGARIKIFFNDSGHKRMVYREVNSGGTFGSNALMQHIGVGNANSIEKIEVIWPGSKITQVFNHLHPNSSYIITEGDPIAKKRTGIKPVDFLDKNRTIIGCAPLASRK